MTSPAEFNQTIRELLEIVRTADLEQVDDLSTLAQAIEGVTAAVKPAVVEGERMQASLVPIPDMLGGTRPVENLTPNDFFPYSPVVGALNPISMMSSFRVEGEEVFGEATLGTIYNGPPGSVHGGMVACLLDELLGSTCVAAGLGGFTGTLSVRYQGLVPLHTEVELHGWVDRIEGRKIFAIGEIRLAGAVLTRAEGVFIRPKDGVMARPSADQVQQ